MAQPKGNSNASGFGIPGTQKKAISNVAGPPGTSPFMPQGPQLGKQAASSYQQSLLGAGGLPPSGAIPPRAVLPPLAKAPPATGYQLMAGLPSKDMMDMNRALGISAFTELPGVSRTAEPQQRGLYTATDMPDHPRYEEAPGYRALGEVGPRKPEITQTFGRVVDTATRPGHQEPQEEPFVWPTSIKGTEDYEEDEYNPYTGSLGPGDPQEAPPEEEAAEAATGEGYEEATWEDIATAWYAAGGSSGTGHAWWKDWAVATGWTAHKNELTGEWEFTKGTPPASPETEPPPAPIAGAGDAGITAENQAKAQTWLHTAGAKTRREETIGFPEEKLAEAHDLIEDSAQQAYEIGLQQLSRQYAMMGMTGSGSQMVGNNALIAQIYNDALQQHMALDLKNLEQMEIDEQELINNALAMANAYTADAMAGVQISAGEINNLLGAMKLINEELFTNFSNILSAAGIEYGPGTADLILKLAAQAIGMLNAGWDLNDIIDWVQQALADEGLPSVTPGANIAATENL
jgi:hypothetical protein